MKNRILILIAFIFSTAIFTACDKDDPEVEMTATMPVSGEWWVRYERQDPSGNWVNNPYGVGYTRLSTYNTAANTADQIWVSDEGNFWSFKVKSNLDLGNRSFSVTDATSSTTLPNGTPYVIKTSIMDGKVIEKGGRSHTGVEVDSIVFMVQFEDEAFPYRVSGHRRTGFLEDEFDH